MNNIQSQKFDYPPEAIKENVVKSETFRDIYDFYSLLKVQKHAKRYARADAKKDKLLQRRLREPLKKRKSAWLSRTLENKKGAPKHSLKLPKITAYLGFQKKAR